MEARVAMAATAEAGEVMVEKDIMVDGVDLEKNGENRSSIVIFQPSWTI